LQNFPNLQIKSLNEEIADIASDIRAKYAINTPDAIQIATSLSARADYFLTNDLYLKKIQDIEILLLDDIEKDKSPFN
jgi:predicted nucleic acid-binding protein